LLCTAALALPVSATRLHVADLSKIVRLTDPEISPNGKSIVVAGHANLDEDRTDTELVLVDVASHGTRVLTRRERADFRGGLPMARRWRFSRPTTRRTCRYGRSRLSWEATPRS
jgi:hypothetical protein